MRYDKREVVLNDLIEYTPLFENRGVSQIEHYKVGALKYPTQQEIDSFVIKKEIWQKGDSLWKYAAKHYDEQAKLWWVIAFFNNAPTDAHVKLGQVVYIPLPYNKVIASYGL